MENQRIDYFKGIACLLIIMIHCRFPGIFGQFAVVIARPAVFYFFIVSGYLSFYETGDAFANKLKHKIFRLIRMTGIVLGLYFVWECILRIFGSSGNINYFLTQELFNKEKIFRLIFFQEDILVGPFWFLFSLILCHISLLIISKKRVSYFYWMIPALLFLNVILSEILPLTGKTVELIYYRNFILTGFPFYLLGYRLHDLQKTNKSHWIFQISGKVGIGIGTIMSLLEFLILGNSLIYIGSILMSSFAVQDAIVYPQKGNAYLVYLGQKYSMYIYCIHWFVIDVISIIAKYLGISNLPVYRYTVPWIIMAISIIGSVLIDWIMSKGIGKKLCMKH